MSVSDAFRKSLIPQGKGNSPGSVATRFAAKYSEETIEAVRLEYEAGLRSLAAIGRQYEVPRATISMWAREKGWVRNLGAKREEIKTLLAEHLIEDAASAYRKVQGKDALPDSAREEEEAELERLAAVDASARTEVVMQDYTRAVAETCRVHAAMAATARETGWALLERFKIAVSQLPGKQGSTFKAKTEWAILLGKVAGPYATLVRALQSAIEMEKKALGIEAGDQPPPDQPQSPSAGGADPNPPPSGSYEDIIREAELRGQPLQ
jgi:hypothetical protein